MVFRQLKALYDDTRLVMEIEEDECAGLVVAANPEHAYTGVEVGYTLPEYDSVNGRYEFNGKFDYSTGRVASKPNILSLVSPYRADSIGIELLCWKDNQHKGSTDDQSDNTVFVVTLYEDPDVYSVLEYMKMEVNGVKLFNALLAPPYLIAANLDRVGISTENLQFTATSANRDVTSLLVDIPIARRLFSPFTYEIACDWRVPVPSGDELNGVVSFRYKGKVYRGFISDASKDYAKETETKLLLHAIGEEDVKGEEGGE
jgi:hypothetical protein